MGQFNSKEFEFADTKVSLLGTELSGLRGLEYDTEQDKELIYAAGNEPKSIQNGNWKYGGTLTVLQSDLDILNAAARDAGYKNIIDVPYGAINITCVYQNASGFLSVDTCLSVGFTKIPKGLKQGDKFKEVALPFLFLRLKQA